MLVTYLVASVALAYGVLLLGERLRAISVLGLVVVLAGVALARRRTHVLAAADEIRR